MIDVRTFESLGGANHGWLDAKHHFSFAGYHDPSRMHWGAIRVWNDDRIAAKSGFPPHPHDNMEIVTYVRTGAITHKDSLGNQGRTEAGDVQVMSAGTGITHAEYNVEDEDTTLFQIWIMPDRDKLGQPPKWGAKPFPKSDRAGDWAILASGHAADADALSINADARVVGATVKAGETIDYALNGRKGYLVAATGSIEVNGVPAGARDGVAVADVDTITVTALEDSELVLVETA
ncbi:pirin family protein [Aurantiacibacter marinus]|uniref:Pirin n=1 Tax=Aurantiacibacter marinus TaxID=874156 RepID=A0A0H0XJR3_9SPHN|nr:pirin family protein [Aurantiacibacter marinus]KLI62803.1 pirin [Aurantiacibacter marinus]